LKTYVWQRYDSQYCLQGKAGSNPKTKTGRYQKVQSKSEISHEYNFGDKVLLEIPRNIRKLSKPNTRPFPVTNVNKNGTLRVRKGNVPERVSVCVG
jgi:hypothetical protein